ncbi:MAG TPA: hypothetical protein VFQ53_30495 [Kofleriaceae bacterium]|nr:hypothetical protein [Kofleriaceae bacterium]
MRALILILAVAHGGCFTSWAITQSTGNQRILDEGVREERVPLPDVRERLHVRLPLTPTYPATAVQPAAPADPLPFALECDSTQSARDAVYHSGFRYGKGWKKGTALMFLLEAGAAATYYFLADRTKPENQLATGFFGLDAIGTAALFFVPRKEIYRSDVVPVSTHVRSDCPAGLLIDIAGETFPVDAAGRIGELGLAALDGWMQAPTGPLRLTFGDRTIDLNIRASEQCAWNRARHAGERADQGCTMISSVGSVVADLEVPLGTLTRAE